MKKVSYAEFGGPDVLRLIDAEEPHAGPGQIRIAVRAAGVNPIDWRVREGQFQKTNPIELPAGVGQDAAGVVDQVGEGVEGVQVGDRVFGEGTSTYAEYAVLSAWARMPEQLSFEEAAGYPSVVETALRIIGQVGVRSGQTLLVSGASGGVGSAVLQIARDRDITVIGTPGPRARTMCAAWAPPPRRTARAGPSAYGSSAASTRPSTWPARACSANSSN